MTSNQPPEDRISKLDDLVDLVDLAFERLKQSFEPTGNQKVVWDTRVAEYIIDRWLQVREADRQHELANRTEGCATDKAHIERKRKEMHLGYIKGEVGGHNCQCDICKEDRASK